MNKTPNQSTASDSDLSMLAGSETLLNAAIVLQEAVEKLLNMPALDDLKSATDDDLGRDYEHGYAPEIQDNAECILLARNALLITGGVIASFQNAKD